MTTEKVDPFSDYGIRELKSIVEELNRKRFYRIEVTRGLFGPAIVRAWGRIGCRARVMVDDFSTMVEALEKANALYWSKRKKGYSESPPGVKDVAVIAPVKKKAIRSPGVTNEDRFLPGFSNMRTGGISR